MSQDTPLNVPFKEKDEAKALGARWNPAAKYWYVPAGQDTAPFAKWLDGAAAPQAASPAPQPSTPPQQSMATAPMSSPLPKGADIDDINAMLRDASETIDDVNFFDDAN